MLRKLCSFVLTAVLLLVSLPVCNVFAEEPGVVPMVSVGASHAAAIKSDGSLWMWGTNAKMQLGAIGMNAATPQKLMDNVKAVSLGQDYSAAINTDGSLWTWGRTDHGRFANDGKYNTSPEPKWLMNDAESVVVGLDHSAAIKEDGTLWMWGNNKSGQLNNTDTGVHYTPVKAMDEVASVAVGGSLTAAVKTDGTLWMWGNGYLGTDSGEISTLTYDYTTGTAIASTPVMVMEDVVSVSLGDSHCAAVKEDGSLWTWGYDGNGRLGNGAKPHNYKPEKIMDGVKSVTLGYATGAAIKYDGTLWTWGKNNFRQLGDDSGEDQDTPVKILDNVRAVSMGIFNSPLGSGNCGAAILDDGYLWMWGTNSANQLGRGWTGNHANLPERIMQLAALIIEGEHTVEKGEEIFLKATRYDKDGNLAPEGGITWKCNNETVLEIIPWGNNLTVKGLKSGKATITATHEATGATTTFDVYVPQQYFTREKDGWPIANTHKAFGYDENYNFPFDLYTDTLGLTFANVIRDWHSVISDEWNGSCFGLSLLSVAQYLNKIDMTHYFPLHSGEGLYHFGYNDIIHRDSENQSENLFTIEKNSEAITLIERAQVSQHAKEIDDLEVFHGDKNYSDLLNYLNGDNAKPLLVTIAAQQGLYPYNHTFVIATDIKPQELSNRPGWYYIPIYDSNYPAYSELLGDACWFYTQTNPCLLVNTQNGDFEFCRFDKKGNQQVASAFYRVITQNIRFYDISKLDESFFTDTLHVQKDFSLVNFQSNDFVLKDLENRSLFEVSGGVVKQVGENCVYTPPLEENSDEVLSGSVRLPVKAFKAVLEDGSILHMTEESLLGFSGSGKNEFTMDAPGCKIENKAVTKGEVSFALQEKTTDQYGAITLEGQAQKGKTVSLSLKEKTISAKGTETGTFTFQAEVAGQSKTRENVTLSDIDGLTLDAAVKTQTSFGSAVSDWAQKEVEEAYENGLIPEGFLGEDLTQKIDRAEFAALSVTLYDQLAEKTSKGSENPFADIGNNPYQTDILAAYDLGITAGTTEITFEPDVNITREQLATMLCRTIKKYSFADWTLAKDSDFYLDTSGVPQYADDADISDYAKPSVYYLTKFGIIKGVDETHFAPKSTTEAQQAAGYAMATKEQAIALSLRIFKLSELWK